MKRFLCLYLLLFPCIVIVLSYFALNEHDSVAVILLFFLIMLTCIGGIVSLVVYGAKYAAKMSLIEASIWNILVKILYLCAQIYILKLCYEMLSYTLWAIIIIWVPLLFSLFLWAISGAFSVIIYGNSVGKGVWPTGIVTLFYILSFVLGIDLILANIHACKCCMMKEKKL